MGRLDYGEAAVIESFILPLPMVLKLLRKSKNIRGVQSLRRQLAYLRLPPGAHAARRKDLRGLPAFDPGIDQAIDAAMVWLGLAQDRSASSGGGGARNYSLVSGWGT